MAEAFANAYGASVLDAESAGILPARRLSGRMLRVMREKGVAVPANPPRSIHALDLAEFDLIVNLCDYALPKSGTRVIKICVHDPMGEEEGIHREIRDQIEGAVLRLIAHFHQARNDSPSGWAVYPTLSPENKTGVTSEPPRTYL